MNPRVSVILPTLNEEQNLPILLPLLSSVLSEHAHEVLIVDDDSPDGTAEVAEELGRSLPGIRVIRRMGERGLSASVLDGFATARGSRLAVMDADLQHDVSVLPKLIEALDSADIALGSRYAFTGGISNWSRLREAQSRMAGFVTRRMLRMAVSDPLSGFFAVRRSLLEAIRHELQPRGWKILLEILGRAPGARVAEIPFTFGPRQHGRTKMSSAVILAWMEQLLLLRRARVAQPLPKVASSRLVREAVS